VAAPPRIHSVWLPGRKWFDAHLHLNVSRSVTDITLELSCSRSLFTPSWIRDWLSVYRSALVKLSACHKARVSRV
jgi:hypothetical protein